MICKQQRILVCRQLIRILGCLRHYFAPDPPFFPPPPPVPDDVSVLVL